MPPTVSTCIVTASIAFGAIFTCALPLGAQPHAPPPAAPPTAPRATPTESAGGTSLARAPLPAGWELADRDGLIARITRAATDSRNGARDISTVLLHGVEPSVAAAGLDALSVLARPEGTEAVLRFMQHRRPSLRRRALVAASRINTPAMVRAIETRLGDPDVSVRTEAARSLADVADHTAVRALWVALDHDLAQSLEPSGSPFFNACSRAIALRGNSEDIARLYGLLRRAPFGGLSDALRAALARNDLAAPVKLSVVRAIADVSTPQAREVLQRIVAEHRGRPLPYIDFARAAAERIQ